MASKMEKITVRHKKILAVDDEHKNIKLLEAKLAPEGYMLETATNGQEALDKVKTSLPDLILLDVLMPAINGYEVRERIRADSSVPYIPIIFLTASLIGHEGDVTVLFSDIRGFTNLAENTDPRRVFEMLNHSLSTQMKVVEDHHGIIDKMSGDEIMVVFEGPKMARNAPEYGVGIVKALVSSEGHQAADGIRVGIGIDTGPVYIGSVGWETMKDYTVVGNTVNIAANKILFTEATKELIGRSEFHYQSLGKIPAKGVTSPLETFELIK
jgi:class 3 adenylate cyclase